MASFRITPNRAGIRAAALTSPEVRAAVAERAKRVAAAAQARTDDEIVTDDAGRSRARSYVTRLGSGARGEAKDRALGSSIDAAR